MKKSSCRRTKTEKEMHARAVSIRKMTDEQLCGYIDSLKKLGNKEDKVMEFLNRVNVPGVGKVTVKKLKEEAVRLGYE